MFLVKINENNCYTLPLKCTVCCHCVRVYRYFRSSNRSLLKYFHCLTLAVAYSCEHTKSSSAFDRDETVLVLKIKGKNLYCSFLGVGVKRQWINESLLCVFVCVDEFVKDKSQRERLVDDNNLVGVMSFAHFNFLKESVLKVKMRKFLLTFIAVVQSHCGLWLSPALYLKL